MKTIDKIKEYYNSHELEILDKGEAHGVYSKKYIAVSLDYIHKYLLKEKVTKRFVARILFKLCKDKIIAPIPCYYADNLVFCEYNFLKGKWCLKFNINENIIFDNSLYINQKHQEYLKYFNSFLKKLI